ncbi:MAG: ribosome hibernation-promoting factor, HPF/YfiA family [Christensenellales bacterium]|jgi:putative sigma-54 modulation protein
MRIEFVNKNYKLSSKLKELIEKKIARFDKYFKNDAKAKVVLSEVGHDKYTMEVTIDFDSTKVRSEVTSDNMYDNIDLVLPKIENQIRKGRNRIRGKLNAALETDGDALYEINNEIAEAPKGKIVRMKKFELSVISPEDATLEMELLGHTFYVFLNGETGKVAVVYKRDNGDYGLLEPEY